MERSHAKIISVQFELLTISRRETINCKWPAIMQPVLVVVLPTVVLLVTSASAIPLTTSYSPLSTDEPTYSASTQYQGSQNIQGISFDSVIEAYNMAHDLTSIFCCILELMKVQTIIVIIYLYMIHAYSFTLPLHREKELVLTTFLLGVLFQRVPQTH